MKTKITLLIIAIIAVTTVLLFPNNEKSEIENLKQKHTEFLKNHPYNETLKLERNERKKMGIPPNKYFEEQYLLEINPATGRPDFEKKFALQKQLLAENFQKNVPGTSGNAWVERGPNNVPGRTRAMLFDPNDATNKRVFAGGVSGGLWVNDDITDSNSAWTRVGIPENLAVSSITADLNNSNIFYVGTGESYVGGNVNGNGIWKSTNGGTSWTHIFGSGATGQVIFSVDSEVTVNSPSNIQGVLNSLQAGFGSAVSSAITGNLVLVDDGTAAPTEGCNALTNGAAINGNIAVIERGSCNFTVKVKNAQDQGAVAVLMINNVGGNPIIMGGTDATVTIPSVMISKADGAPILTELSSGSVNVTIEATNTGLPAGVTLVSGIFHVNDMVTRKVGTTTEIYAAVGDAAYGSAPGTLLGDGSEYGLYRSTNGGSTWAKVNLPSTAAGNPHEPNDIEISSNNTIWLSTAQSSSFGDGGGVIFSSTNGSTFTQRHTFTNGTRTHIELSSSNPEKIYAISDINTFNAQGTAIAPFVEIIKTTNATSGFTTSTVTLPDDADNGIPANDFTRGQAFYDLMLAVDPTNDETIYVGGIDTFRSTDGGSAWTQISKWSNNNNLAGLNIPLVHADIHTLIFDPSNSDKALIATDGGVFYASSLAAADNSTTAIFSSLNNYNTTQIYWGAIGQSTTNEQFLGGSQDNGTNFIDGGTSGLNASNEIFGGDGAYSFIDKDGAYLITALPFNSYRRFSLPLTASSTSIVSNGSEGAFINPAELDDNLDILYTNASTATTNVISRFSNFGIFPLRNNLTDALLASPPTAFKVSPYTTTSTTLIVGTRTGSLLKLVNANAAIPVWTNITGSEFVGSISAVDFGANEQEIMVTFHNYGVKSIWFTEDGGTTWQNKEGNFPEIPVKAVMMNPLLNDEVIIGTDLGVWRTSNFKNASPTWVQSQNGMQNVKVNNFDLRTADNTILASTYGRGLFTGQFTAVALSVDDISVDNNFSVFPNPSNGDIKIKTARDFGKSSIAVYDVNGRQVFLKEINLTGTVPLNMNSLNAGLYIMKIQGENFAYSNKLIIE